MSNFNLTLTSQSFTLPPATAVQIASINASRELLMLQNTGSANPATFKFQTAPSSATDGFALDPASASGGQGGSLLLDSGRCSIDAIYAYSTLGTTVTVVDGSPHFI